MLAVSSCAERGGQSPAGERTGVQEARTQGDALWRTPDAIEGGRLVGEIIPDLRAAALDGAAVTLSDLGRGKRGIVVVMTSADCPIARKYAPRLAAFEREFADRFAFLYVNPVDGEADADIRAAIREDGFRAPYVRDASAVYRRGLLPRTTTEVFVLSPDRRLMYRGAVDDQFRFGGTAQRTTREYLRDALHAVAAGEAPRTTTTAAPGCLVDMPREPESKAEAAPLAYFPEIAEIIARNCLECHGAGGPAPMNFSTPAAVEGRAAMIAAVVREGVMPPTHGLHRPGSMVRDRAMPEADKSRLLAWIESSRPLGSGSAPARPAQSDAAWAIGTPDIIHRVPGPSLGPDAAPAFGRYLVPLYLDKDEQLEAIECRPMMRDAIDTAQVWLIRPGGRLPGIDDLPRDAELLATYSRSDRAVRFAGGVRALPRGSALVVDVLARPMGRPTNSQMRIAMKFAKEDGAPAVRTMLVTPGRFELAPGATRVETTASVTLDRPIRLLAVQPLMGPRGKELRIEAQPRRGDMLRVLDLRRYDWRWQIRYPLDAPVDLPRGTRITVRMVHDNSASNPANPDAGAAVTLGVGPAHDTASAVLEFIEVEPDATGPGR